MVALSTMALGALALALGGAHGLGTNYEHDSVTTYCWAIPRRTNETKLSESDRTEAFSTRAQCPMVLTLSLPPANTIRTFQPVNVTWTVQADFSGANAINNTRLYFGPDKTGRQAQIVHSNVHSCVFGTGCDPFNDGKELVDKTVNKVANFSDNKASFSDSLQFSTPGEYSVLAHIILPNFNESSRFDYAVYSKVTVLEAEPTAAPTAAPVATPSAAPVAETDSNKSSSGLSQGATIAIIVGAVVVVAALAVIVVLLRRRRSDTGGYMQAPVSEAGYAGAGARPTTAMKPSDLTDTNSTSGFQSAWGGGGAGAHRPSGLDNTNQSSASSGSQSTLPPYNHSVQYGAPPRPSDVRTGSDASSQFTSSMHQPDMSAAAYFGRPSSAASAQNPRKKRVDSDVEL